MLSDVMIVEKKKKTYTTPEIPLHDWEYMNSTSDVIGMIAIFDKFTLGLLPVALTLALSLSLLLTSKF